VSANDFRVLLQRTLRKIWH